MPTAYRILPAMTTAGRHHRVCVATSRRPHPHILESGLARSPPLPIIPLCLHQRPSLSVDSGQGRGVGHPHPSPLPSRERGWDTLTPALSRQGRGGGTPSPQPSPVKGEGVGHPHPSPLPSRERGWDTLTQPSPVKGEGVGAPTAGRVEGWNAAGRWRDGSGTDLGWFGYSVGTAGS